jgi:hypothetical protein
MTEVEHEGPQDLEQLIRACQGDWMLDFLTQREEAIAGLRNALRAASEEAARMGFPFRLNEASLLAEYRTHAIQVQAFIQALGAAGTPGMLVMVWRVLQGMAIAGVSLEYTLNESFRLRVVLVSPYGGEEREEYTSDSVNDAALLRHFGTMTIDDKPVFDGFYALRQD